MTYIKTKDKKYEKIENSIKEYSIFLYVMEYSLNKI